MIAVGRQVQINIHCSGLITAPRGILSPQSNLTDFLKYCSKGMRILEESQKYFPHSHSKPSFSDVFVREWSSRNYMCTNSCCLCNSAITRLKIKAWQVHNWFPRTLYVWTSGCFTGERVSLKDPRKRGFIPQWEDHIFQRVQAQACFMRKSLEDL